LEYNKDYFYFSRPDGKFYTVRLHDVEINIYTFQVISVIHDGWGNIDKLPITNGALFEKHERQLSSFYTNKDYLLINTMVLFAISGPYFENKIQKQFYRELEVLFTKYPEQYIKYVNDDFIEMINYQFNIL